MNTELLKLAMKFMLENDAESLQSFFNEHPEIFKYDLLSNRNWLHEAAENDVPDVIQMLSNTTDIEGVDKFGRTPLCYAITADEIAPAKKLIELGANVNHGGDYSPLSCAVYSQNKELLKLLIENGANNETKEELIRFGRGQGYKNIEDDLNDLNYVSAITETFKDKLSTHYGELTDVQCKESPCVLYSKQAKGKFTVYSDNISKNPEIPFEIMFEVTKQGFDTAEEVLTQSYPWLFDWLEVISQVEIDLTQRVIIITREVECTPYQGIALLTEEQINCNDTLVYIYRLFPLYQKEIEFEKQYGIAALFKKFEEQGVSQTILKTRKPIK
ncbi:ankyrin repeat domain-containing protein [Pseudoalteromonas sp. SWXJZ94C]|uniref:ankyrin repeat domain-containing protein n=1 Tax=Pseudoalteromonas sp. SWXJZ94C TaxID=2792065 RepID=UPI0018CF0699|nr:ankyrin repeat domain-containing protein [Pseudoalteromonas sp. SWXJZ94C]MBH0058592.1 ankyrin repeat domain-containing protein [Pseudoalteromonas sp. SWXJZ94C]